MKIITSERIPDSTYFTASDVEPVLKDGALTIYDGKGSRRSWGAPTVTSTVVVHTATFAAVHVGFHHKHRGGQAWYYYVNGERQTWQQLSDTRRRQVLADYTAPRTPAKRSPAWAKSPGKLRTEHKKPADIKQVAYKLVRVSDTGQFVSLYDGTTVYHIGKRLAQQVQANHAGGYYAYPTPAEARRLFDTALGHSADRAAILQVELAGRTVHYGDKIAATYIKPVAVVETLTRE